MPVAVQRSRQPWLLWSLLALLFLVAVAYRILDISERVREFRLGPQLVRVPIDIDLPWYAVVGVEDEAARAGMQPGDRIARINGTPVHYSGTDLWRPLRAARAGDRLNVDITRSAAGGGPTTASTASIVLQPLRDGAPSAIERAQFLVLNVALPTVCLALGFWVVAVRIRDTRAWLLLFLMLSLAEFAGGNFNFLYGRQDWFQPIAAAYQPILANLWPTAMLLFAIYFPERLPVDRRLPWLKWVLIAPVAVRVIGTNPLFEWLAGRDPEAALGLYRALEPTAAYVGPSYPAFIVAFLAIMAYRTVTERQPDARRRLLLVEAGALASLVPALVLLVLFVAGRRDFPEWAIFIVLASLLLFPLTMAYTIVVHRALDVRVVVRQSVQYLLAREGLRVVQLALLVAVAAIAASLLASGAGTIRVAVVVVAIAGAVALGRRFGDRLRGSIDRRFFREAYEADLILSDLATRVRTIVETGPLLETVAARIAESLHVPRVAILLLGAEGFAPAHAIGYAVRPDATIPADGVTARRLRQHAHAMVHFDDGESWVQLADDSERRALEALRPELMLPLTLNQKVLGIMSLGAKRSEEPYSRADMRLLDAVAMQTGLALENGRLTAAVAAEVAARAKERRDVEIARDVQQRLFPQEYPPIPGVDYAGACRPALGVGGDYYDFVHLPGRLGIAIGDVSGKGIPAALLMASLRAYLRGGQTIHHQTDLTVLMATLNRLIYESSAANRYATFFYGELDTTSGLLTYVNGGHLAPMLFRHRDGCVVRLDTGGPVIGLMEECVYAQGHVTLERGDVLLGFTDGISEAMNAADQEWGEEALAAAAREGLVLEPPALIARLLQAADAFVAGAPQHDDMTLVVLRATAV